MVAGILACSDVSRNCCVEDTVPSLFYAYEQPAREERNLVVAETKKMLAGYLFSGN